MVISDHAPLGIFQMVWAPLSLYEARLWKPWVLTNTENSGVRYFNLKLAMEFFFNCALGMAFQVCPKVAQLQKQTMSRNLIIWQTKELTTLSQNQSTTSIKPCCSLKCQSAGIFHSLPWSATQNASIFILFYFGLVLFYQFSFGRNFFVGETFNTADTVSFHCCSFFFSLPSFWVFSVKAFKLWQSNYDNLFLFRENTFSK